MIRIARNISTNISRNVSRSIGTEPDPVLERYSGASAAYSLYDLGNRRGTVVETEATYSNPAVRLRRDSDNTHKSFPAGAFTQMLNWANEDVVTYESDFSAGKDGWGAVEGTATGNVDGIGGRDDCLRFTVNTATSGDHRLDRYNFLTVGSSYTIKLDLYIPSSNSNIDGIRLGAWYAASDIQTPVPDTWTTVEFAWTQDTVNNIRIFAYDGGSPSFTGNGTDVFYIRNVRITQLTSNAYATTWYDQSGVGVIANTYTSDFSAGVDGWTDSGAILTAPYDAGDGNAETLRVEATSTAFDRGTRNVTTVVGEPYKITLWVKPIAGTDNRVSFWDSALSTEFDFVSGLAVGSWHYVELYGTATDTDSNLLVHANYTGGAATDEILVRDVVWNQINKFHNDATQTTADNQPKVVAAGSLVTDANGNVALDFDGNQHFETISGGVLTNIQDTFTVFVGTRRNGSKGFFAMASSPPNRLYIQPHTINIGDPSVFVALGLIDDTPAIATVQGSAGNYTVFKDGVETGTGSTDETGAGSFTLGSNNDYTVRIDGKLAEFIIYNSDQSANRSAIEQSLSNTITTALS